MQTDGQRAPRFDDLKLFVEWPGKTQPKVPSEVSYSLTAEDAHDRGYRQWGSSIDSASKVLRWTKLELVKDSSPLGELEKLQELINGLAELNKLHAKGNKPDDVPRHLSKTTKDIIEFYLSKVARRWVSYMTREAEYVLESVPVDIVVTHPAVCLWESFLEFLS